MKQKCKHSDKITFEQAEKLHKKGQLQTQCPVCHKWYWPCEWADGGPIPPKRSKDVKIKAYIALDRFKRPYSVRLASDSDYWNKLIWKPCNIIIPAVELAKLRRK